MTIETNTPVIPSKAALWTGRIMSYLPCALLVFSGVMKFMTSPEMEKSLEHIQIAPSLLPGIGILELTCTLLYLIPRTAVLGAILLTGYLGGAILTHLRVGDPFIMQGVIGVILWGGLYLREPRLRALIPLRR